MAGQQGKQVSCLQVSALLPELPVPALFLSMLQWCLHAAGRHRLS
jgi:hypothetical protein